MTFEPEKASLDPSRPFTSTQARAVGMNMRSVWRGESYISPVVGAWVLASAVDRSTVLRAALVIHPEGAYASRLTAAAVHGLPVPETPFVHITVTRHQDRRFRPEIKAHVTDRRQRIVVVDGIPVTDVIETFIDCAGHLGLVDMVVLGDALVRRFGISPAVLVRACSESTDYYAKLALLAASFVREGVDSPMESRLRMLIVLAGLPEPVVNYRIYRDDGTWRRRFDLCYPSIKLIVEYDGLHHASPEQWQIDLERREEFDDDGYRILVVTARGIYREPLVTLQRIRRQLVERGIPDVPDLDPVWREYFAS
ncbi:DUF559 domain-containing protein [Nocardioides sp. C4-1]|uniref:DUF559 domain-containing protein n=1 Tax=Nocardioides sp. C4-1 TaxID=3151851 RepID=UPI00326408D4